MNNCQTNRAIYSYKKVPEGRRTTYCHNLAVDVFFDLLSPSVTSQRVYVESCVFSNKLSKQQRAAKI